MQVRVRDWVWLAIAVALLVLFVYSVVMLVLHGLEPDPYTVFPVASEIVYTVVGYAFLWCLLAGAWRRTVWGAPPAGQRDHAEMRHLDRAKADSDPL